MKIKPSVFSIGGAILISLFFTLSLFWIFFQYAGSLNSAKDAISILGGYFGGIATLWAAIIAAYLFNDWREVEYFKRETEILDKLYTSTLNIHKNLTQLSIISKINASTSLKDRKDRAREIRDDLHHILTYVALDHMKSKKRNRNIQEYLKILNTLLSKHRKYQGILN